MKVGILTFHGVANYGATLQTYALFHVIKDAEYNVELIDYFTDKTARIVRQHLRTTPGIAFNNAVKQWRMYEFLRRHVKLTPKRYSTSAELTKYTQGFDIIICGSDEIWNIHLPLQNCDFNYFLEFVSKETLKISYKVLDPTFLCQYSEIISLPIVKKSIF
jgi:hypothetical protein